LVRYGTLWADKTESDFGNYPFNYLELACHVARRLYEEVILPSCNDSSELNIVIEETTASQANYSQKKLEWIHYAVLDLLRIRPPVTNLKIFYIRDGVWKNKTGARQNAEEKKINGKISRYKKKHGKKLAKLDLTGSGKARVVGKLGPKHYAIRAVREHFGIELQLQQEDSADAILLGKAFVMGVPVCDGTPFGGNS